MLNTYKKEFDNFEYWLYCDEYHEMFDYLYGLLNSDKYEHKINY